MRRVLLAGLLAGAATAAAGWWAVPLVAAVWARAARRDRHPVRSCAIGAALAWALLIGAAGVQGPVAAVARRVGGVFGLPAWAVVLFTLLFPALLAAAAVQAARPPAPR